MFYRFSKTAQKASNSDASLPNRETSFMYDDAWMQKHEEVLAQRREKIREYCKQRLVELQEKRCIIGLIVFYYLLLIIN